MDNIETWTKLLYTYGPFALLILFIFVVERLSRNRLKHSDQKSKTMFRNLYIANWIFIFALVIFSIYAWSTMNLIKEKTLHGTIEMLEGSEGITSSDEYLYTRKSYDDKGHFTYHLQIFTPVNKNSKNEIVFMFDRSTPEIEKTTPYKLTIQPAAFGRDFRILYNRIKDTLIVESGDSLKLCPLQAIVAEESQNFDLWDLIIPKAFAQERLNPDSWKKRLESTDPIIRNNARSELTYSGKTALPWIDQVLSDPTSSYLLIIGLIKSLNDMRGITADQLSTKAVRGLIEASIYQNDQKLRSYATKFLSTSLSPKVENEFDKILKEAKTDKPRAAAIARSELDFLYNYGVKEKDQYQKNTVKDKQHLDKAIALFRKAWDLRARADLLERVQFSKALYGWGLALHDKSWIDRKADGGRNSNYVKAAQDKFKEFLASVRNDKNSKSYQYPQHLYQAEKYILNPVPESLKSVESKK